MWLTFKTQNKGQGQQMWKSWICYYKGLSASVHWCKLWTYISDVSVIR